MTGSWRTGRGVHWKDYIAIGVRTLREVCMYSAAVCSEETYGSGRLCNMQGAYIGKQECRLGIRCVEYTEEGDQYPVHSYL